MVRLARRFGAPHGVRDGGAASEHWPDVPHLRKRVQERLHPQVRVAEITVSRLHHPALRGAALLAGDLAGEGESR